MELTAMRYKDYVWPHNPRTYRIQYQRKVAVHKVPFGRYAMQDMGLGQRVMTGEGEFYGEGAYTEFKKLATVFYQEGAGTLFHPIWQTSIAYFVELSLAQEPREDYVRYTFTFWEDCREYREATFQKSVERGRTSGLRVSLVTSETEESDTEEETTTEESTTGVVSATATKEYHTVSQGETLWGISRKYGLTLAGLLTLNPQLKNPNTVAVGTQLRVR